MGHQFLKSTTFSALTDIKQCMANRMPFNGMKFFAEKMNIEQHNTEIYQNIKVWNTKKSLQSCYQSFYKLIAEELILGDGSTVELGSGMGNIKSVIPHCITTDLFATLVGSS